MILRAAVEGKADEGANGLCELRCNTAFPLLVLTDSHRLCCHPDHSFLPGVGERHGRRKSRRSPRVFDPLNNRVPSTCTAKASLRNLARSLCQPRSSNPWVTVSPHPDATGVTPLTCTSPDGWSLLGGGMYAKADRLARTGWKPIEADRITLMENLPAMIDAALEDDKPYVHIS